MSAKISLRKIKSIFYKEYRQWIINPKMLVLGVLIVMIREIVVLPMENAAIQMSQPLNALEPVIAIANSGLLLLLIPLIYLVVIADFPSLDGNTYFYLMRSGRVNWIGGQLLFQAASLLTYLGLIISSTMVQVASQSFLINGWSMVVGKPDDDNWGFVINQLLPLNLYYQMSPYMAFGLSYFLLIFFLMLCSGIMLLASLYGKKTIAFWGIMLNVAIGIILCAIKSKWMWLFPVSHSIVWLHYQNYYRDYVFSPWASAGLLVLLNLIILIAVFYKVRTVNLDVLREEKE